MKKSVLLAALLAVAAAASAAVLKTDNAKSSVSAVFKQMNVPIESPFKKHNIVIDYNAAAPDTSKATVEIETASLDLGEADMNKEVAKKEWFNSAQFPKATFVSSAIKSAGAGKLKDSGKLTISSEAGQGSTFTVSLPKSTSSAPQPAEALPAPRARPPAPRHWSAPGWSPREDPGSPGTPTCCRREASSL